MIVIGAMTLSMSTSCDKEDDEPEEDDFTCSGIMGVQVTGFIEKDLCFDKYISYMYKVDERVDLYIGQNSATTYSFDLSVTSNDDVTFTGVGEYNCGEKMPGFAELRVHGDNNDFYKSQSGTIKVTKSDANSFEGSFNVKAKGFNNGKTVTLKGTFKYKK